MAEEIRQPNQLPAAVNPERKTLDDRAKMTDLERIRHSCAHVMATAIMRLWPEAQFAYGPPVENGIYYDLECSHRISPDDFEKIEAEMKVKSKPTIRNNKRSQRRLHAHPAGHLPETTPNDADFPFSPEWRKLTANCR